MRETGGGSLEADLGKVPGIVTTEEINELILVEAVLEDVLLGQAPFEVTAGGPVGDVAFGGGITGLAEGSDDVFVRDIIPEHSIDHVMLEFGKTSDATGAPSFARLKRRGHGFGIDESHGLAEEMGGATKERFSVAGGESKFASSGFAFGGSATGFSIFEF